MRAVSRYLRCQVAVAPLLVAADADVDLVLRLQFRRHHDEAGRRVARRLSPNPSRWNSHFISWLRFFWCVCVFLVGFLFVWFVDFGFVPFNRTFIPRQLFFCSPYSPPCSVCVCVCAASIPSKSIYSKDQCVAIKLGCCRTLRFRWGTRPAQSTNTERFHAPAHSGAGILSTDFIPEPAEAIAEHRFSPHAVGSKSIE